MAFRLIGDTGEEPSRCLAMPTRREIPRVVRSVADLPLRPSERHALPLGGGWTLAVSRKAVGGIGLALLVWALIVAVLLSI